jgi:hypothetical protein
MMSHRESVTRDIEHLIQIGAFQQAYERLVAELAGAPISKELIYLSRILSSRVRSRCIDLASNKATDGSAEVTRLEGLLQKIIEINGEDVYGQISESALHEEHLPQRGASWREIAPFALTFNAYNRLGGLEPAAAIANSKARNPVDCTLTELRAALFFEHRRYHHFGGDPDTAAMVHIHALVEEIRVRLHSGDHPLAS